ncbi:hypothetical protein GMMP15_2010036 [Candidatus Magnetomoraceae bacterium gMMP-15]
MTKRYNCEMFAHDLGYGILLLGSIRKEDAFQVELSGS